MLNDYNTLTVTDERGYKTRIEYDPLGNESRVVTLDSDGDVEDVLSSKEYDSMSRLDTEKVYQSNTKYAETSYDYDLLGRITSKQTKDETNTLLAHETYAYDDAAENGLYQKVTKTIVGEAGAPSIVTTSYTDKLGRVAKQGRVLGNVEYFDTYTYDYAGNMLTEKTARTAQEFPSAQYTRKWEYDYANRPVREYNAGGDYAETAYDALGRKVSFTDFKGSTSEYEYDDLGRTLAERTPFEETPSATHYSEKQYEYDPNGNVVLDRTLSSTPGAANETWRETGYVYDERGFLTGVEQYAYSGSSMNAVKYEYDEAGNQTLMRTGLTSLAGANAWSAADTVYEYDHRGFLETMTDPMEMSEEYTYDLAGNMLTKLDRNGATTYNDYDALGRLVSSEVADEDDVVTAGLENEYYLTGAKKSEENANTSSEFEYDELGRLVLEESDADSKEYSYDIAGNRKDFKLTVSGSTPDQWTKYNYDAMNRLAEVFDYTNGYSEQLAAYEYDENGNRSRTETIGDGYYNYYTDYEYNAANMLTYLDNQSEHNYNPGNLSSESSYEYTYYLDGNQKTKTDHNGVTAYEYDAMGRLTLEDKQSGDFTAEYSYDERGNRSFMSVTNENNWLDDYWVSYFYDENNRLTQRQTSKAYDEYVWFFTDYTYDGNGNETGAYNYNTPNAAPSARMSAANQSAPPPPQASPIQGIDEYLTWDTEKTYDGFNQLQTFSLTVEGILEQEASYTYNPNGLRHSKTIDGDTTVHFWDGQNMTAEQHAGSGNLAVYHHGINLIASGQSGNREYYLFNGHGDTVQTTDLYGIYRTYDYDAFGNEQYQDDYDGNPFRYAGQYYDFETGTYYLRARSYDPGTGRFLSEDSHWNPGNMVYGDNPVKWNEREVDENDPLGLNIYTYKPDNLAIMQSGNLYAYSINNPVMYKDTSGEFILAVFAIPFVVKAVAAAVVAVSTFAVAYTTADYVLSVSKKDKAKGKTKQPSKESGKERATDIPSWAKGSKPKEGQNGKEYAEEQMDTRYGKGNWKGKPDRESEYSKLKKHGDRG